MAAVRDRRSSRIQANEYQAEDTIADRETSQEEAHMFSRLPQLLFAFSILMAVFTYGIVAGKYEVFPYEMLDSAKDTAFDLSGHWKDYAGIEPTRHLRPARRDGEGVTVFEPGRTQPGLTLITGLFDDRVGMRLIALDGTVIHQWSPSFGSIWPAPHHILPRSEIPKTDWNTLIHGAVALPDGSVVFNFENNGLVKLDRCGQLVWSLPYMTHHSVFLSEDGTFWVAGQVFHDAVNPELKTIQPPFEEDMVLQLSPDGRILREISMPQLLLDANMEGLLFPIGTEDPINPDRDMTHLNDVEILQSADADAFPMFAPGDVMVSLRNINLVMVFDPNTRKVKWYETGPWQRQHDPDFTADGKISIFNNRLDGTKTGTVFGGSNIMEVDPATRITRVLYAGNDRNPFFTSSLGKHQHLENGNILITEAEGGRIFEVDADGRIVWEFVNRYDRERVILVEQASRYPEDYFRVRDWSCDR